MPTTFVRDRFTWLAYFMLSFFAYVQAVPGPAMPFLGDELNLSYTVKGLHFSAFALGMVTAGLTGDRVSRKLGRYRTFWGGGAGMVLGAMLFILGQRPPLTIFGALLMGTLGGQFLVIIQAALSDHHGDQRAVAFTESNLAASVSAGLAPLLVGGLQRVGLGWRGAMVAGAAYGVLLWMVYRHVRLPGVPSDDSPADSPKSKALPPIFWAYWLVIFVGVAIEWSFIFWGADFLEKDAGLSKLTAAAAMSVFFVAAVIGRATSSWLTRIINPTRLLMLAFGIAMAGFFSFWLAPVAVLSIGGLFIAGLGVSNFFPLGLSVASSVILPHQSDAASGRVSFAAGAAILIAPQVLGSVADVTDISRAYGVVAVLMLTALGVIWRANRLAGRIAAAE